ncbi:hypothetical protein [Brasilonema sp. UFV-L1]|uniref:hypothetical protein n=1 Tax=Brasilonema sp. UFV-L1 TaxID=2234130 RepID=UPI00145D4EC5|nr:hypothetical protein [Brasilonema sp. UFV-L1]
MGSRIPTVYTGASAVGGFPDLRHLALSTIGWGRASPTEVILTPESGLAEFFV